MFPKHRVLLRPLHDRLTRSLANELLKVNMQRAGDELALVEAATNVVRHGYGPEGGPIRIEASTEPRGAQDTGPWRGEEVPPTA